MLNEHWVIGHEARLGWWACLFKDEGETLLTSEKPQEVECECNSGRSGSQLQLWKKVRSVCEHGGDGI